MAQYLRKVQVLAKMFESFQLIQINRSLNNHADALSKLASSREAKARMVKVEVLERPSIEEKEVLAVGGEKEDWRTPIKKYLLNGELPEDLKEAKKVRVRGARFVLVDGILYKKAFSMPLLKCLGPEEVDYAIRETHEGICGEHLGARALAAKILRAGFYWPTMKEDAMHKVRTCDNCQGQVL